MTNFYSFLRMESLNLRITNFCDYPTNISDVDLKLDGGGVCVTEMEGKTKSVQEAFFHRR